MKKEEFLTLILLSLCLFLPLQSADGLKGFDVRLEQSKDILKSAKSILKNGDAVAKMNLVQQLRRVDKKGACSLLVSVIKNEDEEMALRQEAVKSLSKNQYKRAYSTLESVGKKLEEMSLLHMIVDTVMKKGDAVKLTGKGLTDSNQVVRAASFQHMAKSMADGKKANIDEKLAKRILREKKPIVLFALAQVLSQSIKNKNALPGTLGNELMTMMLDEKKSMEIRGVTLSALAKSGVIDEGISSLLKRNYYHENWKVRLDILEYMENFGKTAMNVKFLIKCMMIEEGRLRTDIADILTRILGCKNHGVNPKAWKTELINLGGDIMEDAVEAKSYGKAPKYYGLKFTSKRPVFVLDITGSMMAQVKPATKTEKGTTRMDAAKLELCRALRELDKELRNKKNYAKLPRDKKSYFNIMLFNTAQIWWKKEMMEASKDNIEDACKFVMNASATSMTYTADALRSVFKFSKEAFKNEKAKAKKSKKKRDKKISNMGVDTIFLVTDGAPSRPPVVKPGSPPNQAFNIATAFGEMVKDLYKDSKIMVNCIGILFAQETPSSVLEEISKNSKGKTVYVDPITGKPINK